VSYKFTAIQCSHHGITSAWCRARYRLMSELSSTSDESNSIASRPWTVGAECVSLRDDGRWYRAKITDADNGLYRVIISFILNNYSRYTDNK